MSFDSVKNIDERDFYMALKAWESNNLIDKTDDGGLKVMLYLLKEIVEKIEESLKVGIGDDQ